MLRSAPHHSSAPALIGRRQQAVSLRVLLDAREILSALVTRQLKLRYRQTAIGIAWIVVQPLIMITILSATFGRFPGFTVPGVPYALYVLSGYVPWQMFSRVVADGTGSLVAEQNVLAKVYFPRIIVPMAVVLVGMVDLAVLFSLFLVGYLVFTPDAASWRLLALPVLVVAQVVIALGVVLWTSALNVRYRDLGILVPFVLTALFFLSPIMYPTTVWPTALAPFFGINPMLHVVNGFRWALFGTAPWLSAANLLSVLSAATICISGFVVFQRRAEDFVDDLL